MPFAKSKIRLAIWKPNGRCDRIQLDIMEYADLNQHVRELTTIVSDIVLHSASIDAHTG
jgi:hypothetical protein